jgi:hypothetical protein
VGYHTRSYTVSYTRNDLWRIKRAAKHLDKALDGLSRANGDLRPKQFAELRKHVEHATNVTESVIGMMEKALGDLPPKLDFDDLGAH